MEVTKNAYENYLNKKEFKNIEEVLELAGINNRILSINDIDEECSNAIDSMIRFYNILDDGIPVEDRKPIKIYIDSQGGSLTATLAIIDVIKMSKTPVYTINMSCAYSGGFFILINGHKRFTYSQAAAMYHEGSIGISTIDANKFSDNADFYKTRLGVLKDITISSTKITEELYNEHKKDDWYFNAEDMLKYGIVDEIITSLI